MGDRREELHEDPGHHGLEVEEDPVEDHHEQGLQLGLGDDTWEVHCEKKERDQEGKTGAARAELELGRSAAAQRK